MTKTTLKPKAKTKGGTLCDENDGQPKAKPKGLFIYHLAPYKPFLQCPMGFKEMPLGTI